MNTRVVRAGKPGVHRRPGWTWAAAFLLWSNLLAAGPRVDARLDTTLMCIGDPVTLTLAVRTLPGQTARFPDLQASLGDFELLSSRLGQRYDQADGSALELRTCEITTFETGQHSVPAIPFAFMAADGAVDTVFTDEIPVQVLSLLEDTTAAEVRPIKGLMGVPRLWHRLAAWGALSLALLVALIYAWRAYLARRRARLLESRKPLAPSRPPHLVALEELDRIKAMGLIEKGQIKLFHFLVSDVVRRYLEARFEVNAPDMTTWETMLVLDQELSSRRELRDLILEFLEACDLVKFAKYQPRIVEINTVFNQAYQVVERAKPEAVPVTGPDSSESASGPPQEALASRSDGSGGQGEG